MRIDSFVRNSYIHVLPSLPDVETLDLARRGEVEVEVRSKVAPLVRVKRADQVESVALDALDRGEPLMARHGVFRPYTLRVSPLHIACFAPEKEGS